MKYREVIEKMTLEEKASMFSGKDFWQTMNIDRLGINSIFLADGPHGIRKQAVAADHLGLNESLKATCFPTSATMANSWNTELGEEMGAALGKEAVAQKVNVLLGPGTNIKRNPLCGRNFEYFSEDPYLSGKMAASYIRGIQSNGISACVKHFAANNQEERRMAIDTITDERTLREIYLTAFEIAVKEGKTKSIMSSYNMINGTYANEYEHLLVDILRKEWGFNGVVVTDWGGSNDRIEGLKCGNELEMPTTNGETNRDIVEAVKKGKLNETVLDECLDRLLTLIFDTEEVYKKEREKFDTIQHHKIARKCAEESVVLLKNAANILPLSVSSKVCIIGDFAKNPRYQGAGSSVVNPTCVDNTLEALKDYGINYVGFEPGFTRYGKKSSKLVKKAVKLAEKSDTILLYIGLDECTETEGLDRSNMKLPENQLSLIVALKTLGKKIVAVLSCGSSVEMSFSDSCDAIVHGYLSGQAGARAVLNVLTGKVNPSGKLAETYLEKYEDCSSSKHFPGKQVSVEYREGIFVGYRYYDSANVKVKYPFGYGLSYTTFKYNNINADGNGVTFTIKNTGDLDGSEIAQLYVGLKDSAVFRAEKELKGFKKVFIKSGEEKTVTIPFDEYTFRFFNVKTEKWEVESGKYDVLIGASSKNIVLKTDIVARGISVDTDYDRAKLSCYYGGKAADVPKHEFEALIGHAVPNSTFIFVKKNRIVVDYNTTVLQLKYSKGWTGRLFAGGIKFGYNLLRAFGKRKTANVIAMGLFHNPMRGISRMSGGMISWGQLNGMITMFNGKFFKGLSMFIKAGKAKKKIKKTERKAKLAAEKAKI